MEISTGELRDFAGALHPADFSRSNDLPTHLLPPEQEFASPNEFLKAWAPHTVKFGNDLVRGIEAFREITRTAADRFGAADGENAATLNDLADRAQTAQPSTSQQELNELPRTRELTGPLTPPEELTNNDQENSILGSKNYRDYGAPL